MFTYKGYEIGQAPNHHIWIRKDNRVVLHAQCNEPKSEEELKEMVDNFLELTQRNEMGTIYHDNTK